MATLTKQDYLNILENGESFIYKSRISFLRREDESVSSIVSGDILDGNLTVNWKNGARRSVTLSLVNINKEYNPNQYGIWVNSKFSLEIGIEDADGNDIFFKQGVFVVSEPEIESGSSSNTMSISGIDKFSLLNGDNGGNLDATYITPVGSDINVAIKNILDLFLDENSQFPIDAKPPILQKLIPNATYPNLDITPYTLRTEKGKTYSDVLLEYNNMVSRNMYYGVNGNLVSEEDYSDGVKGSLYHYRAILDVNKTKNMYLGSKLKYMWKDLYNKVEVIGFTDTNGVIYNAVATNDNATSRTSVQRIGVKFLSLNFPEIYTEQLALDRANYELRRRNAMQSTIVINSIPNLILDVDRVIEVTDDKYDFIAERMLITSLSIPLKPGSTMTITAVKTEELILSS